MGIIQIKNEDRVFFWTLQDPHPILMNSKTMDLALAICG